MSIRTRVATFAAAAVIATFGGAVAPAAIAVAAPLPVLHQAPAPNTGELRSAMADALNTGLPRNVRAAGLESGEAGLPLFDRLGGLLAIAPASFRWDITNPRHDGGDITIATLYTKTDGYDPFTTDAEFKFIDGRWKLSQQGQCSVAAWLQQPC